jgi:hypothetical protein
MTLQIGSSLFLKELVSFLSSGCEFIVGISRNGYFFGANRIGAHLRTLMNAVIFDEAETVCFN